MLLTSPMPFDAAVRRLESKTPIATRLNTAELQQLGVGVLDRAFFSARVDDIRTVAQMQSRLDDALTLTRRDGGAFMDRSRFIADMRGVLGAAPGDSGALTDITSAKRLGLIYDFNTEDAIEYGRWLARQDSDILAAYPCSELVRIEDRKIPRGYRQGPGGKLIAVPEESWPARWEAAGGRFFEGRMIARKDDPIWIAISRFGRPWPPFDFMSGMGVADISEREAVKLGVIEVIDLPPAPQAMDFNHNLQASVPEAEPAILEGFKNVFGDQVTVSPRDGKIMWQGERVAKLYDGALTDPQLKWSVDLGAATPEAMALAAEAGADLVDARLVLTADDVRHIDKRHGAGEPHGDQRPVTSLDVQLIPHVWRSPDSIEAGDTPGTLVFKKELLGQSVLVGYDRQAKSPKWGVSTLYVKKEEGTP